MDEITALTGALVLLTGYYAWQTRRVVLETRRMVEEMERARHTSLLPKLGVDLVFVGPNFAELALSSVGLGPAFDVDVELICEPTPNGGAARDVRAWRANLLVPGEKQRFKPPEDLHMDEFAGRYQRVTITGTMRDALGKPHPVDEAIPDLTDTWERLRHTGALWAQDPTEKATRAVQKPLESIRSELATISQVVSGEHERRRKAVQRRRRKQRWSGRAQQVRRRFRG